MLGEKQPSQLMGVVGPGDTGEDGDNGMAAEPDHERVHEDARQDQSKPCAPIQGVRYVHEQLKKTGGKSPRSLAV